MFFTTYSDRAGNIHGIHHTCLSFSTCSWEYTKYIVHPGQALTRSIAFFKCEYYTQFGPPTPPPPTQPPNILGEPTIQVLWQQFFTKISIPSSPYFFENCLYGLKSPHLIRELDKSSQFNEDIQIANFSVWYRPQLTHPKHQLVSISYNSPPPPQCEFVVKTQRNST